MHRCNFFRTKLDLLFPFAAELLSSVLNSNFEINSVMGSFFFFFFLNSTELQLWLLRHFDKEPIWSYSFTINVLADVL